MDRSLSVRLLSSGFCRFIRRILLFRGIFCMF